MWKLAILTLLTTTSVNAFDLPKFDPWYYQRDNQGIEFMIPDKAQHYYGSYFLNEVGKSLPISASKITVPVITFGAGFAYETWQEGQGIGFSYKDLIADGLGVLSSQYGGWNNFQMYLDYSTREKTITLHITKQF